MSEFKIPIGTLYHEHHLRRHRKDGSPVMFWIWCAEVIIDGKRYRRKSLDVGKCICWLEDVHKYTLGQKPFPARLKHPGESPEKYRKVKEKSRSRHV